MYVCYLGGYGFKVSGGAHALSHSAGSEGAAVAGFEEIFSKSREVITHQKQLVGHMLVHCALNVDECVCVQETVWECECKLQP